MTPIQKAFSILNLEPGSSKKTIQTRYRRLIMVWHPDRFTSAEDKAHAENELKQINNAKDLLWKHFDSGTHKASGCECQQSAGHGPDPGPKPGPGPGPGRKTDEEEAKRRDAERKRKAAAEEAERQEQERKKREAQQQTYEAAATQEAAMKEHALRWKIAQAEGAILVALCLFGWVGTGINAAWHDFAWHWEQDHKPKPKDNTNTTTDTSTSTTTSTGTATDTAITPPKPAEEDPCSLTEPSPTPPKIIHPYLHNWVKDAVAQWTVTCKGNNEGAVVCGRDDKGRIVNWQNYGPNWVFIQQWQIKYEYQQKTVMLFKAPNDFDGRCIYRYDQDKNLIEIDKLDSQQRQVETATIQRRIGGGFYQTILKFYDSTAVVTNTRMLYTADDPEMSNTFYLFEMFGNIPKTVEQAPALTSPDLPSTGTSTDTFMERLNKLNQTPDKGFFGHKDTLPSLPGSGPGVPYGTSTATSTSTDEHLLTSPFTGESVTPGADALLKKWKEQEKNSNQQWRKEELAK